MSCYISSNNNRFYVALESMYGGVPAITNQNRIPAVKLAARQVLEQTGRRDKTGSRTFPGLPSSIRRRTAYQLSTFLTEWGNTSSPPAYGPLFQAAMGGSPLLWSGGTVASATSTTAVTFSVPHGLSAGQGVTNGSEIRFVAGVQNSTTISLNAPFTQGLSASATMGPTITYPLAESLGSISLFDYWDPSNAIQRVLCGAAVDKMRVKVNGDYQEFVFGGPAQDLLDSASFTAGQGALTGFPTEPQIANFDYTIVAGHLGQVWMGVTEAEFLTVTQAELALDNSVDLRVREFGSDYARCIAAGRRSVRLGFTLFEMADQQTAALYQAARQRSPIGVMLQLGSQGGQLFGVYLPATVPEVPEFDDSETRLQWRFQNSRAQGTAGNELYVAFG